MKIKNYLLGALLVGAVVPSAFAQVPQVVKGAVTTGVTDGLVENIGRAAVRQVELTAAERALLPVDGTATHKVFYHDNGTATIETRTPYQQVTVDNIQLSTLASQNVKWFWSNNFAKELSPKVFPNLAGENVFYMRQAVERAARNFDKWVARETEFLKYLQRDTYQEVPWYKYLPSEPMDFFFIGEGMWDKEVYAHVFKPVIKELQRQQPNRKIILATGYVSSLYERVGDQSTSTARMIRTKEELQRLWGYSISSREDILRDVLDEGIEIAGVEPETWLREQYRKERSEKMGVDTELVGDWTDFMSSEVTIRTRQYMWTELLNELKAANPDALIVVHGPVALFNKNTNYAVPSEVKGKSFTMQVASTPSTLYISPEFYETVVRSSPMKGYDEEMGVKEIFSFKPDFANLSDKSQEMFRSALGGDVVVIFDGASERTRQRVAKIQRWQQDRIEQGMSSGRIQVKE